MSFFVTKIVRRARLPKSMRQRPECKAIALALADRADDEGGNSWPSIATMAAESEISDRTAQKCIRLLVAEGLIIKTAPARQHRPITWRLPLDSWLELDPEIVSAPQHVAPLEALAPQTVAPLSRLSTDPDDPFGLGVKKPQPGPQLLGSGVQNPTSGVQRPSPDPVLLNCPSLNDPLNTLAHSKKVEEEKAFDQAREIAKRNLFEKNLPQSVAMAVTLEECAAQGIDQEQANRALANQLALQHMRSKFSPRKAATT